MHGFEECCHLGLRSILQILWFHIFTASSKARLGRHTCSKLIVRALKDGSRIKGSWLVRDRNARASSGRQAEKGKKKIPTIFISIFLLLLLLILTCWTVFLPWQSSLGWLQHRAEVGAQTKIPPQTQSRALVVVYSCRSAFRLARWILLWVVVCIFNSLGVSLFLRLKKLLMNFFARRVEETAPLMISPRIYYLIMESAGLRNSYHLSSGLVWLIKEVFLARRRYQYI